MKEKEKLEKIGGKSTDWRQVYWRQKTHAKRRGIAFKLTFQQWILWWGPDIWKRGRGDGKLQMCRKGDTGAYELGNIYKATCNENSSEKFKNGKNGFRPSNLSDEDVASILVSLNEGVSQRKLAERFNVSQRTINRINLGQHRPVSSEKVID